MALFGTNGVRGKLDSLSPQLAYDLAGAFSGWCKPGSIMLSRDMRLTSPMFHSAAMAGILASGRDCVDIGLASSPVSEFMLAKRKCAGLIIITASHNPPEWNALKFVDGEGRALSRERGQAIEKAVLDGSWARAGWDSAGKCEAVREAAAIHSSSALKFLDALKIQKQKLRVVLDFGNGTSALSQGLFESLGCEVIALNEKIDGRFPGRPSEPSEANVQGLCKAVRGNSADFGVAWDGDSDRVVFVDERGQWIVGDKGFAVSALSACKKAGKRKKKFVVTTVATSRCVEEACAKEGAKTIYTKVGAPYISEEMVRLGTSAVSGGEEVGGIIWPEFSLAKDGIFSAAKIAELVCGQKLSSLVSELPTYCNSKTKVAVDGEAAKKAGLQAALAAAKESKGKITTIDGVRADFEDGWAIVRASGTENYMRIFAEGKTQKRADALMKEFKDAAEQTVQV
ncbi:MAG: phosphoglucosamine mutase [Candidatus Micrarchaeota archaeon]|nr:phosphoglucosamine mutase [Candidatus Micrarchaeota archaeon]